MTETDSSNDTPLRVLMASGGTGGHVFPGVHIANAIAGSGTAEITFVGVGRPTEERIISNAGYEYRVIKTVGLKGRGLKGILQFTLSIPKAFLETLALFREKRPAVIIATGGYPSFFPVMVAFFLRIPRWLHEAERKPGLANSVLSLFANRVSLAFSDASMPFWARTLYTGHPVRASLKSARRMEPLAERPGHVLFLGGSQGSQALDDAATMLAPVFAENNIAVWHQCRAGNEAKVQEAYQQAGVTANVVSFIDDVDAAYQWSDFIIARSGAGTVSEIAVVNRPAIFIPYPFAQGNHQESNARVLADRGKATIVKEGATFEATLLQAVFEMLQPDRYRAMYTAELEVSGLTAAGTIASAVRALVSNQVNCCL